ncbi:hypothetical protein INO84_14510, partial [Staphylococcus aureus]|nr:hypothetical protein [Staphylococcus aureus]
RFEAVKAMLLLAALLSLAAAVLVALLLLSRQLPAVDDAKTHDLSTGAVGEDALRRAHEAHEAQACAKPCTAREQSLQRLLGD